MDHKENQTDKKIQEKIEKTPSNSSNKSRKTHENKVTGDNKDKTKNMHVGKQDELGKENKDDPKHNSVDPGEQDESADKSIDEQQTINKLQIKGNFTNVGMKPSCETNAQSRRGTAEDQKPPEKSSGGDIKSDTMKTSRFSNIIGCWRDELIVVSLVMTIVTLVFLLFVCFHYERKIDNMNIELDKFKTEFKKPNPAIGTDTCLQNDDNLRDLNTKTDNIGTKMNETINNLGDKMLTEIQNISTVLTETISLVRENDIRLSNELTGLNVSFDSFKTDSAQKHDRLNSSVNVLNETIEHDITEKVKSFDHHLEKLQNATENATRIISQLEKDVDKIYPNTFNKGALTMAFVIVIVFVLVLYVYVFLYLRNATGVGRTRSTLMHNNSVAVLSQIPYNPALENSVCIVSFDEQRCPTHRRLVTPACQGREINTFVVRQHASLLGMPRCRLYIMCAEFSERHVIIEQPNLGLGDLKRCTHDAVRKIGGELVILYTRDPGSRRLADGQMFNRDIYCVNDQPELRALRDRGRFISLYDSLTPSQTQKLTDTVNECLQ